jgi:hypothetical protein
MKQCYNEFDSFGDRLDEIPDWKVVRVIENEHIFCFTLGEIQNLTTNPLTGREIDKNKLNINPKNIQRYNIHQPESQTLSPNQQRKQEIIEILDKFKVYLNPSVIFKLDDLRVWLVAGMFDELQKKGLTFPRLEELSRVSPLAGMLYVLRQMETMTQMTQLVDVIEFVDGVRCDNCFGG